jgi:hypothetical protein
MVPVLIWLVFLIPSLPGDGRTALNHVPPTAISRRGYQGQRRRVLAILEQTLQQILCRVDRYPPCRDRPATVPSSAAFGRYEPKAKGNRFAWREV